MRCNPAVKRKTKVVLLAEDDEDDLLFLSKALQRNPFVRDFRVVVNEAELMDYLQRRGPFANPDTAPRPDLILLDLDTLRWRSKIHDYLSHEISRHIPVVFMTESTFEMEILSKETSNAGIFFKKVARFSALEKALVELFSTHSGRP